MVARGISLRASRQATRSMPSESAPASSHPRTGAPRSSAITTPSPSATSRPPSMRANPLAPGETYEYEVALDGEVAWPEPGSELPPSRIRTYRPEGPFDISFGSCRVALPHEPPYTLSADEDPRGKEADALYALAQEMLR